mgnify:FL=1
MIERRSVFRFKLQFPTRIEVLNGRGGSNREILNLKTRDISSKGAFIETQDPLPEGTHIKLDIFYSLPKNQISAGANSLIQAEGKILRSQPDGMAVSFKGACRIVPLDQVGLQPPGRTK